MSVTAPHPRTPQHPNPAPKPAAVPEAFKRMVSALAYLTFVGDRLAADLPEQSKWQPVWTEAKARMLQALAGTAPTRGNLH